MTDNPYEAPRSAPPVTTNQRWRIRFNAGSMLFVSLGLFILAPTLAGVFVGLLAGRVEFNLSSLVPLASVILAGSSFIAHGLWRTNRTLILVVLALMPYLLFVVLIISKELFS